MTFKKKRFKKMVFQEVKKFKIVRYCKGCGKRIVVKNANRYYCDNCRQPIYGKEDG